MSYRIKTLPRFEKSAKKLIKKYPSLKSEISELISELTQHPTLGILVQKNCYKIRLAIKSKGKGKSGGARVISYVYVKQEEVTLLDIYDKSEQSTISDSQLKWILQQLD